MKLNKKLIAAGVCAGMTAALLSGCSSKSKAPEADATVAAMGDTKLSLGVANLMYRVAQAETGAYLRMLIGDDGTNLWEQDLYGAGIPYGVILKENIMDEYKTMSILEQHMVEYGVEITEEDQEKIKAAAESFLAANTPETLAQMTATQETVERLLTLYTIEDRMEAAIKAAAEVEVTEEEAAQKQIRYAYFPVPAEEEAEEESEAVTETASESEEATEAVSESEEATEAASESEEATEAMTESATDSEETTEAEETSPAKTALMADVQGVIDDILAGTDMEEAVHAYSEDINVISNNYGADTTALSDALIEAADTLTEEGQMYAEPIEVENGFYILQMVSLHDEEATAKKMESLEAERRSEFYSTTLEGWEPEDFAVDEKVWDTVNYADDFRMPMPEEETGDASDEATEEATEAATDVTEAADATEAAEAAETTETVTEAGTEAASETESEA